MFCSGPGHAKVPGDACREAGTAGSPQQARAGADRRRCRRSSACLAPRWRACSNTAPPATELTSPPPCCSDPPAFPSTVPASRRLRRAAAASCSRRRATRRFAGARAAAAAAAAAAAVPCCPSAREPLPACRLAAVCRRGTAANPRVTIPYRWDFGSGRPRCGARFEGHIDWVNGLALVSSQLLASCSSDRTVKLWKAASTGEHWLCFNSRRMVARGSLQLAGEAACPAAGVPATPAATLLTLRHETLPHHPRRVQPHVCRRPQRLHNTRGSGARRGAACVGGAAQ